MLRRIKRIASSRRQKRETVARWQLEPAQLVWAVGSLCALNRIPFDAELLLKQFPPPYTTDTLIHAVRALGFRIKLKARKASALSEVATPCLALLASSKDETAALVDAPAAGEAETTQVEMPGARLGLITDVSPERVQYFEAGTNAPTELPCEVFAQRYLGVVFFVAKGRPPILDPDVVGSATRFGFRWFVLSLAPMEPFGSRLNGATEIAG
jgi:subfamily B ATP-binding cassette protein HlyB/CyaB